MCQSYCKIQTYFSSTRAPCAHSPSPHQCFLERASFPHCSSDQCLLPSSPIPHRSFQRGLSHWSAELSRPSFFWTNISLHHHPLAPHYGDIVDRMQLRRGKGGGGVCGRQIDFLRQRTLAVKLILVKGCLSGEEEEDGGGGCLSEEENVERIRRVVGGKLSSRASVADRRRRVPDIPCGFTCLFS